MNNKLVDIFDLNNFDLNNFHNLTEHSVMENMSTFFNNPEIKTVLTYFNIPDTNDYQVYLNRYCQLYFKLHKTEEGKKIMELYFDRTKQAFESCLKDFEALDAKIQSQELEKTQAKEKEKSDLLNQIADLQQRLRALK